MVVQNLVNDAKKVLSGLKVSEYDATILLYLNLAKNQIAMDTLMWLSGETVTLVSGTNEYELSKIPIQIIDVYDDSLNLRPRNSSDSMGYFQTSPKKIFVNSPHTGSSININYYYTPDNYILTSETDIPESLYNALQYFIVHKAYEMQKTDSSLVSSREYFARYNAAVKRYLGVTDNGNLDTVLDVDLIKDKGLV